MDSSLSGLQKGAMGLVSALSAFGIGIGIYMTYHHEVELYGGASLDLIGCKADGIVNCNVVNTSAWSELFGVPQFTWAIPFFLLAIVWSVWAIRGEEKVLKPLLGLGVFGSLYSVMLGYISYVELGFICNWCVALYCINFSIPVLALVAGALKSAMPTSQLAGYSAAAYLLFAGVSIGGQRAYRNTLTADTPQIAALKSASEVEQASDAEGFKTDPEGSPPALTFTVTTEDKTPNVELAISPDDPYKGNPDASIAIVEFADFECGYCKRKSGEIKRLLDAYGDKVVVVYKHYPMNPDCNGGVKNKKHRYACLAADAAACAQKQGYFWAMHDLMFKNNHRLKPENLKTYAVTVGLDLPAFETCMRDGSGRAKVIADTALGTKLEIHGTPRIWINGQLYRAGNSAEQMAAAIERALGADPQAAIAAARQVTAGQADVRPPKPIAADVSEMTTVSHDGLTFQIDTFESGLDDGKATTGNHVIPATRMSWFAANDACNAAGKRLCTEEEWVTACQGARAKDDDNNGQFADDLIEGTTYPYGDFHVPGRCWDGKKGPNFRPVYTGEMPGCNSVDGVYDLTGNVEEWVGTSPETAVLIGGSFDTSKDFARCFRRNNTYGPGYASVRTGFRCCSK